MAGSPVIAAGLGLKGAQRSHLTVKPTYGLVFGFAG